MVLVFGCACFGAFSMEAGRRFLFLLCCFPLDGSASYNTQVCFRSSCTNIAVDKMQTLEFRALNPAQPATPTKSKLQAHHHEQHASNTVISKSHNHNIACFKIPLSHPAPSTTFTSTSVTAFSKSLRTHSKGGFSQPIYGVVFTWHAPTCSRSRQLATCSHMGTCQTSKKKDTFCLVWGWNCGSACIRRTAWLLLWASICKLN